MRYLSIPLRSVAYHDCLLGFHCRARHQDVQTSWVRLQHSDVCVTGADHDVRIEAQCRELVACRIVGKYPNLFALLAQALEKFRQMGIPVMDEMAKRSSLEPLPGRSPHSLLAAAGQHSGSGGELPLEVLMEGLAKVLPDAPIGAQYADEINITTANRGKQHFPQHAQTQTALIIQRAIDVKHDQLNLVPAQIAIYRGRAHCSVMYRWPVNTVSSGMSTYVATMNKPASMTTKAISLGSRNSFSGFCADDAGLVESNR